MKPASEIQKAAGAPTRVEFEFKVSAGPKGRRRISPEAASSFIAVPTTTISPGRTVATRSPAPVKPTPAEPFAPRPAAASHRQAEIAHSERPAPKTNSIPSPASPTETSAATQERVPKIVLLLVLGHHFERLVREGIVRDYSEIARRTGLTRARVTQIVNLTLLAPEIQEAILALPAGIGGSDVSERPMRALAAQPYWRMQH